LVADYTFATFVVGAANEVAFQAAQAVSAAPGTRFNPVFFHGGVGLGKTHLVTAIAHELLQRRARMQVACLSAESFMNALITSLRQDQMNAFRERFRQVDVLILDDVQFLAGKERTQEEFFHTFNALHEHEKQIVLTSDKPPRAINGLEQRLRSRFEGGLIADIHPPTREMRLAILRGKANACGIEVSVEVAEVLVQRSGTSVRELEGALNRIVAHATLVGRPITLETAQEVLHDLLRANDRRVTIEEIQKRVAEHFSIRLADMHSPRRARAVARPRQVAMYLAKQLTSRSLPEIGRKFGGRDHTTVMHAVRKIEELRASDQSFSEDIELLRRMLEA
jgi:chromosomal replication initiator protein